MSFYIGVFYLYRKATRLNQTIIHGLLITNIKQVLPSNLVSSAGLRRKD
jgi:hypothetical protein